jgi:phospholipase/lecithinase/hemolysin
MYYIHILSKPFPMGHKHTHLLAAVFSFLAVAQLMMVMDLQKEINAINDSAQTAMLNSAVPRITDRGARKMLRVVVPDGTVLIHGQKVIEAEIKTSERAGARARMAQ